METNILSYLGRQQDLTAVERFATAHTSGTVPRQERFYRDLIPIESPRNGQRLAFEVDLDACTGCKACVTGCHNRNGLDAGETWRQVGTVSQGSSGKDFPMTVTTACHHCEDPACLSGCPVKAYEKDEATGIVRHLDDQCIGCQYCVMKCPYDVPQYDSARGIVRKCDMCIDRLGAGEAPACVQSCPNEAIRIVVTEGVTTDESRANFAAVPGAPDAAYTRPTTIYRTVRRTPGGPPDTGFEPLRPEQAHFPLVAMLVLSQTSVGVLAAALLLPLIGIGVGSLPVLSAATATAGVVASTLHLGRPLYAFRALLGLKTSWLSREVLALGLYAPCIAAYALVVSLPWIFDPFVPSKLAAAVTGWGALGVGTTAVFCSSMVYVDTPRPTWSNVRTPAKFFLTALTACAFAAFVTANESGDAFVYGFALPCTLVLLSAKVVIELDTLARRALRSSGRWKTTNELMSGPLLRSTVARVALFGIAITGVSGTALIADPAIADAFVAAAILAAAAGELIERYLFFAACSVPRMPGVPRPVAHA